MARRSNNVISIGLFVLLIISFEVFVREANCRPITTTTEFTKRKGTVKTIESDDGDVIDCVDIYKQPAFDHPLLIKNHTLQMKPSSYPRGIREETLQTKFFQIWQKNGECPVRSIPIRRNHDHDLPHRKAFIPENSQRSHSFAINDIREEHEYAQASLFGGTYYGARASINVWNPLTLEGELSLAQIWLISGNGTQMNTIEAGWQVYSGSKETSFFIYWTSDFYQSTGCYNLDCPGFVQVSRKFAIGGPIQHISSYGGDQVQLAIKIYKETESENWWLQVEDEVLGYWPGSIFTHFHEGARGINWGGEITNTNSKGHHTSTQMGSGHFPDEGPKRASFFSNLSYIDDKGALKDPENLKTYASNPSCYDIKIGNGGTDLGTHFYFGGPGYSDECQ